MKKNYFIIPYLFLIFIFTCCSSEKDSFSAKPPIDSNKPPIEVDFTLFPKDHVPNSDLYVEGEILQNQSDNPRFLLSTRHWQGVPSIGKDKFGNLYVAFLAGSCYGECDYNYLTVSVSRDNGISWSDNKLVLSVTPQDATKMNEANFFNDKYGNLYMYWGKYVKKDNVKEWIISWYSKINLSDDGTTINYTPPRRIAEGIMLNKLFYSDSSDQVLFPIARWNTGGGDPNSHQPFIYKANYGSNYLTNLSKVGFIPLDISLMTGAYEHMIVQLKDSTYLGMVRTPKGIYYSKSKDGSVWDQSMKFNDLGDTPVSRFHLGRLKSGRLIFIFNNDIYRSNLTVCLSDNDGVTWPYKMVIDNTKAYADVSLGGYGVNYGVSYPDMIETSPGVLNIVYDRIRAPEGNILFVKIREDDIVKNITSNIFRSKISTLK